MTTVVRFGQIPLTEELRVAAMLAYTIMVFPKDANVSAKQIQGEAGTIGVQVSLRPEGYKSEDFVIEYNPKNKTLKVWPTDGSWKLGQSSEEVLDFLKGRFSGWTIVEEKDHWFYCWYGIEQEWLLRLVPEKFRSKFES